LVRLLLAGASEAHPKNFAPTPRPINTESPNDDVDVSLGGVAEMNLPDLFSLSRPAVARPARRDNIFLDVVTPGRQRAEMFNG
jgi:hypothetical protein